MTKGTSVYSEALSPARAAAPARSRQRSSAATPAAAARAITATVSRTPTRASSRRGPGHFTVTTPVPELIVNTRPCFSIASRERWHDAPWLST